MNRTPFAFNPARGASRATKKWWAQTISPMVARINAIEPQIKRTLNQLDNVETIVIALDAENGGDASVSEDEAVRNKFEQIHAESVKLGDQLNRLREERRSRCKQALHACDSRTGSYTSNFPQYRQMWAVLRERRVSIDTAR